MSENNKKKDEETPPKKNIENQQLQSIVGKYKTACHELAQSIWAENCDHSEAMKELENAAIDLLSLGYPSSMIHVPNDEKVKELVFWTKVAKRVQEKVSKDEIAEYKAWIDTLSKLKQPIRKIAEQAGSLRKELLQIVLKDLPPTLKGRCGICSPETFIDEKNSAESFAVSSIDGIISTKPGETEAKSRHYRTATISVDSGVTELNVFSEAKMFGGASVWIPGEIMGEFPRLTKIGELKHIHQLNIVQNNSRLLGFKKTCTICQVIKTDSGWSSTLQYSDHICDGDIVINDSTQGREVDTEYIISATSRNRVGPIILNLTEPCDLKLVQIAEYILSVEPYAARGPHNNERISYSMHGFDVEFEPMEWCTRRVYSRMP